MHKSLVLMVTIVLLGFFADAVSAATVKLTATVGQVRSACSSAGGTFSVHPDGAGYGCTKKNCDGKGGECSVHCGNNNQCHGHTPGKLVSGKKPLHVLTNAGLAASPDRPSRPKATGGLPSSGILDSGPGFSTQGPAATGAPAGGRGGAAPGPTLR